MRTVSSKIECIANDGNVHFTEIVLEKPGIYKNPDREVAWFGEKHIEGDKEVFDCWYNNKATSFTKSQINEMKILRINWYFNAKGIPESEYLNSL